MKELTEHKIQESFLNTSSGSLFTSKQLKSWTYVSHSWRH